jgi:hypothetical protein
MKKLRKTVIVIFCTITFAMNVSLFAEVIPESSLKIDADFPGGNIKILGVDGDTVRLRQDLRDTNGSWFYWSFRIRGAEGRKLNFVFTEGIIGTRGPAISTDDGLTWRWIGETGFSATKFQYQFSQDEKDVYFSQGMNYTEKNLKHFLKKYQDNPYLKVESLCKTKKGRNVELLRIFDNAKSPKYKVFLSSRHHCAEMTATYTLEGIIETVLSDTNDGQWFRDHVDLFIVPLVDKDGVEDGDQGKNRKPHDHNRDYIQQIHESVQAITEQVPKWLDGKPLFYMDMHCPWLRGGNDPQHIEKGTNEYVYFVGIDPKEFGENSWKGLQRFSTILEKERKGTIPYRALNNLPFGVSWNSAANKKAANLRKCCEWGSTLPNVVFASAIEIPFANAEGAVVDADSAGAFGRDLARTIRIYLETLE